MKNARELAEEICFAYDTVGSSSLEDLIETVINEIFDNTINKFSEIVNCHMSCEQSTEHEEKEVHKMFHIAQSAIDELIKLKTK